MSDGPLAPTDPFVHRHIGPSDAEIAEMLEAVGFDSLNDLADATVPESIRSARPLRLPASRGEHEVLEEVRELASRNQVYRSYIGMGYHGCIVPAAIQRNILENPGWYTQYTPYQAEISQGRLEALFNFQTMVCDLTGLPVSNSSLLDEGTAAAEAMSLSQAHTRGKKPAFFASTDCHPQTIDVLRTRCLAIGVELYVGDADSFDFEGAGVAGVLVQYPTTDGRVLDYSELAERVHGAGALFVVAADLLSLTLLREPGAFGADIAVGSSQRLGVPMGFGGPHAGYLATTEKFKRQMPGRIIGLSKDTHGDPALRLALQTREQHIRREKATSNICTAQVLLAVMASTYAVYHGPEGLRAIAQRIHTATVALGEGLKRLGYDVGGDTVFDTIRVRANGTPADEILAAARAEEINLRRLGDDSIGISLDETVTASDIDDLLAIFARGRPVQADAEKLAAEVDATIPAPHTRTSDYLTHPVFHKYRSETELMRYLKRLESRDLSLAQSMISLGSCTMKLNATTEMLPVTWPEFGALHPFAPLDQAEGYLEMFRRLEAQLAEVTGFHSVSLQPNAGSQGEFTGLLVIRRFHEKRGEGHRNICLIPASAHGTNPASAVMVGMKVVVVKTREDGAIDVEDMRNKAQEHAANLAATMVTYPSTNGVFEEDIREICDIVHEFGGQVYMDGANLNAQLGLCSPGGIGADVCHLNLHKTFCIPHGGGGPGMGPIGVADHLTPFLPGHSVVSVGGEHAVGAVSSAPWGSPSILPISFIYNLLMGRDGLLKATQVAILNANYMALRLGQHYPVLFRGARGCCAHEFIIDLRPFEHDSGVTVEDVAKRLMDYGFHAPTMSFPVAGTLMIEPTESETKGELDRLCDALIAIREEIRDVSEGRMDKADNPLKNAPHTARDVCSDEWTHPYSRQQAAYPAPWVIEHKFWPAVGRVDNVHGDRNLICTCPSIEEYAEA